MKIEKDDMIVGSVSEKKRKLIKVLNCSDGIVTGTYLKNSGLETVMIPLADVAANLGPKPTPGWVYSIGIAEMHGIEMNGDGQKIIDRTEVPPAMKKMIKAALKEHADILRHIQFDVEIHGDHGKRLGFYRTTRLSTRKDVMGIHLTACKTKKLLDETIIHEAGHGIWNRIVPAQLKSEMIQLYLSSITLLPTELPMIKQIADRFDAGDDMIAAFGRKLSPGDKVLFKKIVAWIKAVHHVGPIELDGLKSGGTSVLKYFPSHKIVLSRVEPIVTQYGTKNVDEFFCEAFALHHTHQAIPREVTACLKKLDAVLAEREDA